MDEDRYYKARFSGTKTTLGDKRFATGHLVDLIRKQQGQKTIRELCDLFGVVFTKRANAAVQKVCEYYDISYKRQRRGRPLRPFDSKALELAKAELKAQIALAKAEAATAKPYIPPLGDALYD